MKNSRRVLLNVLWTDLKLNQMCNYDTLSGYIEKRTDSAQHQNSRAARKTAGQCWFRLRQSAVRMQKYSRQNENVQRKKMSSYS